jgi:hypothetical protein
LGPGQGACHPPEGLGHPVRVRLHRALATNPSRLRLRHQSGVASLRQPLHSAAGDANTHIIGCAMMRRARSTRLWRSQPGRFEINPATVGGASPPRAAYRCRGARRTENIEIPDVATCQILTSSRRLPLPAPTSQLAAIAIDRACLPEAAIFAISKHLHGTWKSDRDSQSQADGSRRRPHSCRRIGPTANPRSECWRLARTSSWSPSGTFPTWRKSVLHAPSWLQRGKAPMMSARPKTSRLSPRPLEAAWVHDLTPHSTPAFG